MIEHEMILLDADFRTDCARLTARRKQHAEMAEVDMHLLRNEDYSGSTPDFRSTFEERE